MSILEVKGLRKVYTTRFGGNQVEALRNVSFSVEQGEYVAVMGESGSGKTTLLNILAALDKPTAGSVVLDGRELSKVGDADAAAFRRDNLGFVFQEFNLLDTFSLEDNIALPLVLAGKGYREINERLMPVARRLGIAELLKKYPYEVSGGQKQRAAVARAIITRPSLLLADEPTGALDSRSSDELLRLFGELNRGGQTIVMVTHSVRAGAVHQGWRGIPPAVPRRPYRRTVLPGDKRDPDPAGDGRDGAMKFGLYPRLALAGIRKNKRLYIPYLLTCTGMAMMYYIIIFLQHNEMLDGMRGGTTASTILALGGWVVAIFACIFLFYTHSFLLRRRKKEFGLYNILGMGRRHLVRIEIWETIFVAIGTTAAGLLCGIAFSKLAELGLMNLMHGSISYVFSISAPAIMATLLIFGVIHLLLLLRAAVAVGRTSAIQLLQSEAAGEKPPRANWFLGLLGVILLGVAYYMAVTIKEPLMALALFFVAVVLVILATYLIMISGSVLLCRQLQKNTAYYYNPRHFVSVSSMAYRMKRNGAGLASVCILATMVLVMLSSTTSLYFGAEDSLMARYPRELSISYGVEDVEYLSDSSVKELREEILAVLEKENCTPQNVQDWRSLRIYGYLNSTRADFERTDEESQTIYRPDGEIYNFVFVSALDYNALTGENVTLDPGEAAVYTTRGSRFSGKEVDFGYGLRYDVAGYLDTPLENGSIAMDIAPTLVLVVPDLTEAEHGLAALGQYPACRWNYGFDTGLPAEKQAEISNSLYDANIGMHDDYTEAHGIRTRTIECRTMNEADFFGTYGGLFCLGIILSVEFLFAAVLIIYYKQISEGYEDQSRFGIMQKVGMTKTEIRRSINSQLLTVFYLPLVMAGLHLAFAFPMIHRLLLLFNLNNVGLFALTTVISFVMFGVLYALIYRITGNVYYRIVSDIHDRE